MGSKKSYPAGSKIVTVPRTAFPRVFRETEGYNGVNSPYLRVTDYTLVIVPSGVVRLWLGKDDVLDHGYVYSGQSGRLYEWSEYFYGEYGRRSIHVHGHTMAVECVPDQKDHHNPPKRVSVYASTAGVMWLVLRSCIADYTWTLFGESMKYLTELEDAPLAAYSDRIKEDEEMGDEFRTTLVERLNVFFGFAPTVG